MTRLPRQIRETDIYSLFNNKRKKREWEKLHSSTSHVAVVMPTLKYRTKTSASLKCPWGWKKIKTCSAKVHAAWLISAGTRTRSLWIRSPARYSIAPQRLRQHDMGLVHFYIHIPPYRPILHPCSIRTNPKRLPLVTTRGQCCLSSRRHDVPGSVKLANV